MKRELNKWQIGVSLLKDYSRLDRGWKIFDFHFLKLISLSPEGEMIHRSDYKGIYIKFYIWFPIESY